MRTQVYFNQLYLNYLMNRVLYTRLRVRRFNIILKLGTIVY